MTKIASELKRIAHSLVSAENTKIADVADKADDVLDHLDGVVDGIIAFYGQVVRSQKISGKSLTLSGKQRARRIAEEADRMSTGLYDARIALRKLVKMEQEFNRGEKEDDGQPL
jgi:hypothetical protein